MDTSPSSSVAGVNEPFGVKPAVVNDSALDSAPSACVNWVMIQPTIVQGESVPRLISTPLRQLCGGGMSNERHR